MAEIVPLQLTPHACQRMIRELAADSDRIVIVPHARRRQRQRHVTRRQVELCLQRGTIQEGPFINAQGDWQANVYRHASGEELMCTVAIQWGEKLIVITVF